MEDVAHEKPDQNPVAIGLTQQLLVADGGLNSYDATDCYDIVPN